MPTIHVMTGLPGCGKTTIAKSLNVMRFNLDDLRRMLFSVYTGSREREAVVVRTMLDGAKAAVLAGYDIVLDNTHLVPRLPKMYKNELGTLPEVEWRVHDLTDVTIETCIERDADRLGTPAWCGEAVIRKMAKRMTTWRVTEDWLTISPPPVVELYVPNLHLPTAMLVDVDGTVALNNGHRSPYDYTKVLDDDVNWPVVQLIQSLQHDELALETIFISGREDRCYPDTVEWLQSAAGFGDFLSEDLFMRKTGDNRPDFIIKYEIFNEHIRHSYNVVAVFDDRDQVVQKCWRAMGLQTYQVANGDF